LTGSHLGTRRISESPDRICRVLRRLRRHRFAHAPAIIGWVRSQPNLVPTSSPISK
jgi:hypothetical protein